MCRLGVKIAYLSSLSEAASLDRSQTHACDPDTEIHRVDELPREHGEQRQVAEHRRHVTRLHVPLHRLQVAHHQRGVERDHGDGEVEEEHVPSAAARATWVVTVERNGTKWPTV